MYTFLRTNHQGRRPTVPPPLRSISRGCGMQARSCHAHLGSQRPISLWAGCFYNCFHLSTRAELAGGCFSQGAAGAGPISCTVVKDVYADCTTVGRFHTDKCSTVHCSLYDSSRAHSVTRTSDTSGCHECWVVSSGDFVSPPIWRRLCPKSGGGSMMGSSERSSVAA